MVEANSQVLYSQHRVDLLSFKQKLKVALKDSNKEYWDCLKKFCQSKLTKIELDTYARSVLVTEENIALHNLFIKAIINNASIPAGHPSIEQDKKSWKNQPPKKQKKDKLARKRLTRDGSLFSSSGALDDGTAQSSSKFASSLMLSFTNAPHLVALRNRMYRTATENGMEHVTNDTVLLMMKALEQYISEILKYTISHHKVTRNNGNFVSVLDLHETVESRPYLLGEDLSLNLERIGMAL